MLKYAIGQSVPRTEDPRLLKGRGRYVDDYRGRDRHWDRRARRKAPPPYYYFPPPRYRYVPMPRYYDYRY